MPDNNSPAVFGSVLFRHCFILCYAALTGFSLILLLFGLIPATLVSFVLLLLLYCTVRVNPSIFKKEKYARYLALISGPRYYTVIVALTVLLAFVIRVYNLTALDPYTDEYAHLWGAIQINELGSTSYSRAYILTYSISWLFKIFGHSLYVGRIPGVIFGALTVLPLYLLAKKISEPVGIIAILLWTFNPWAIMVARNIREYAIYPFFFLIILLIALYLIENIIKYCNNEKRLSLYDFVSVLLIIFSLIYAKYIDPLSTFKYAYLLLPPVFIYFLYRTREINDAHLRKMVICFSLAAISVPSIVGLLWSPFIDFIPEFNQYFLGLFWGTGLKFIIVTLFALSGLLYFSCIKRNHVYSLTLLILLFELYVFSFHWDRYVRPRYGFYLLPFFITIMSSGIYATYRGIVSTGMKRWMKCLTLILLLCLVFTPFNPINAVTASTWDQHGYVPWSDEYHDPLSGLSREYANLIDGDDAIISSLGGGVRWTFNLDLDRQVYGYSYTSPLRFDNTAMIVESYESGWIFLDTRRNNHWTEGFPSYDFSINNTKVAFHGRTDGWYVYSWGKEDVHRFGADRR